MKSEVIPLFPSVVHRLDVENYPQVKERVIKFIYEEQKKDPQGRSRSNVGGWQSHDEYINEDNILRQIVDSPVSGYFDKVKVRLLNLWVNINKKGDYNEKHHHPQSDLSGVMWIKVPSNSGRIWFDSPHNFKGYNEINSYSKKFKSDFSNYLDYWFSPMEGRMILFPSYLYHRVEPSQADEDRISVSFNVGF